MDPATLAIKLALDLLKAIITPVETQLVISAMTRNPATTVTDWFPTLPRIQLDRLKEARELLDKGRALDLSMLKKLKELALMITVTDIYGDIVEYVSKRNIQGIGNSLDENLREILSKLETLQGQLLSGESSSHEIKQGQGDQMPVGDVRRCLLYLSLFPNLCVFNRNRILRLLVGHKHNFFGNEIRGDPTILDQLVNRLHMVESSLDGNVEPQHFLIGNGVKEKTKTWPELDFFGDSNIVSENKLGRFIVSDSSCAREWTMERIPQNSNSVCSLVYFGRSEHDLDLKLITQKFRLLRILSLRNANLENEKYIENLSLLRYLDLKHSNVRHCDWLEGLEELETLDLRHTNVEEVPDKCLKKLGKLQCLLLGYLPKDGATRLVGARLKPKNLTTKNLKIVRMIRRPEVLTNLDEVTDLSITGLGTQYEIKSFLVRVNSYEHLTSLGVAVAQGCTMNLDHCPPNLMQKLQRLRLEGEFSSDCGSTSAGPHAGLDKLCDFKSLIDLTLASPKPINNGTIPSMPNLICLRLYGARKGTAMTFGGQGLMFRNLKKLVIGDMKQVKKIEIDRDILQRLATLKLCNLPKFQELLSLGSQLPFLRVRKLQESRGRLEVVQSVEPKTIFLKAFQNVCVDRGQHMDIYIYDMNKQC